MNRPADFGLPATPTARHMLFAHRAICKIALIRLHIFVLPPRINQPLTTIGKDHARVSRQSDSCVAGAIQTDTRSNSLCGWRPRGGNGEQAWP
jgi:hypothetical protein